MGFSMAADPPADFVARPKEFEALRQSILYGKRDRPTAITTALRGAGGYGKTTLAQALCQDEQIKNAFADGILWVTLGESQSPAMKMSSLQMPTVLQWMRCNQMRPYIFSLLALKIEYRLLTNQRYIPLQQG